MPLVSASTTVALLLMGVLSGCATTRGASASRVAVFPSSWVTDPVLPSREVDEVFAGALESQGTIETVLDDVSPPPCEEDLVCLRAWGSQRNASSVARLRLAGLGETVVVRAHLIDVDERVREQTRQEVVSNASGPRIRDAVTRLGTAFAPEAPPRWFEAWWVWTLVGVVIVGGVTSYFLLRSDEPVPDFVITPP